LPRKAAKKQRPLRYGVHFWLEDSAGRVLLRRRPPTGLLGGMTELPGPVWRATPFEVTEIGMVAPMAADWRHAGRVFHGLTHFELAIDVYAAVVASIEAEGFLSPISALADQALPSVMRKCAALTKNNG
jgi:A/G-specific adenine glycosylase